MQDNFITTIEYSHFTTFLTNAIKYIPDNKYLLCSVASFFEKKEDLKKACPLFLKALELDPENPKILYNVGLMAAKSENLQSDCEKYFLKSLEIDPNQHYVYTNLLTYYNKNYYIYMADWLFPVGSSQNRWMFEKSPLNTSALKCSA